MKGAFIAFEGIDGSGKSTQSKLLISRLKKEGYSTSSFDFPQYGEKSAGMIEEYLSGKYGKANAVSPEQASLFYACDRYDASFQLRSWLQKGRIVVSDRYVASNMGHQGGKIASLPKRKRFFRWLYELEYTICNVPKPTISIFLEVPFSITRKLQENTARRRTKKKDIHEKDSRHLRNAYVAYHNAMKLFLRDFLVVECVKKNRLLSKQEIHEIVWAKVQRFLPL